MPSSSSARLKEADPTWKAKLWLRTLAAILALASVSCFCTALFVWPQPDRYPWSKIQIYVPADTLPLFPVCRPILPLPSTYRQSCSPSPDSGLSIHFRIRRATTDDADADIEPNTALLVHPLRHPVRHLSLRTQTALAPWLRHRERPRRLAHDMRLGLLGRSCFRHVGLSWEARRDYLRQGRKVRDLLYCREEDAGVVRVGRTCLDGRYIVRPVLFIVGLISLFFLCNGWVGE